MQISEEEEWKTSFWTRYGSFEYPVMPFGLTNALATFQHFMNDIFQDMADLFVIVYLDDILVFSMDTSEHEEHFRMVLERLWRHNLHAKLDKCTFHTDTIEYLRFIVSHQGIAMDLEKYRAIEEWPCPKTVKEIQLFLGFANFYRRFIEEYSGIVIPLTHLTCKDTPFLWTRMCEEAFLKLKEAFAGALMLAHFNPNFPIIVEMDASDYAVSGIISQIHPEGDDIRPIAFFSRTMVS